MMRGFLRGYLYSATAIMACAAMVQSETALARDQLYRFNIPGQDLGGALNAFARASRQQVTFDPAAVRGKKSPALDGTFSARDGLRRLLIHSGLSVQVGKSGVFIVRRNGAAAQPAPMLLAAAQDPGAPAAEPDDAEIIVTAQKREERLLDVPIAISAFRKEALAERKIEGGSELLRAVPNVNFSKGNFSMYNFSIRGIGTKAISASSDPAVAVSFNNTPLIRNRLFEQEFFDVARVEVLRGPQGTLYGRNATGGVVNLIPELPGPDFEGEIKAEIGSYDSRRANAMINVPLGETFSIRAAGALTKRDGFDYNSFTKRHVNDRDLWSTRLSAQWEPSDRFKANVIWEHFNEKDRRSRTGKQLCTPDPGPTSVGDTPISEALSARLSQGCLPGSLYDDAAYGTPNGSSFPFVYLPRAISPGFFPGADFELGAIASSILPGNPFEGVVQSRDLREISTSYDPVFRAKNDVVQLNLEAGLGDNLTLISQTAYARDRYYSSQDYNRFVSNPIFLDSAQPLTDVLGRPLIGAGATPGGIYTDPQLGASDRMLSVDISRSRNRQWSQEFRLQSASTGPLNFNLGANYLNFKSEDKYYVFNNLFTFIGEYFYNRDGSDIQNNLLTQDCPPNTADRECIYIDPNPLNSVNDQGHNYFLSRNLVKTKSWAAFGELYWQAAENVKVTLGARYTRDRKTTTPIPSQLLLGGGGGGATGGYVNSGYPALPDIDQKWGKFTGRAVIDWKPQLSFTSDTLVYASVSHGYKGGGSNPPRVDINPAIVQYQPLPTTFKPEYVNAFEIGTKNSLDGGRLTFNATAFFYDYKDYQVSQIVDRISLNENFDAENWGLEFEAAWKPSRNFRMDANLGYLRTRLKKGSQSIDVMNRTQGNEDWVLLRPWLQVPSNCIAPKDYVERIAASPFDDDLKTLMLVSLCNGSSRTGSFNPNVETNLRWDRFLGFTYDPLTEAPNGGRGFAADLEGNELPNSPRITFNLGAQYTFFVDDWELTFRGDYYRQGKSFARVYNTEYDRLKAWDNLNLAVTLARPQSDLSLQFYVKNVFNDAPITDFFTNSDDTGLTANVFTLDPRIFGFSMTKHF